MSYFYRDHTSYLLTNISFERLQCSHVFLELVVYFERLRFHIIFFHRFLAFSEKYEDLTTLGPNLPLATSMGLRKLGEAREACQGAKVLTTPSGFPESLLYLQVPQGFWPYT